MTIKEKVDNVLQISHLTKEFPHVVANHDVSFDLSKGEIHSLLGENGAGKSTLAKCICGLYKPDSGEIYVKGRRVEISSPREAIRAGIGMVSQHFGLAPPLNVIENIIVGAVSQSLFVDFKKAEREIKALCENYNIDINLRAPVSQLSVREQQWVEILKALYGNVDILILDEPTDVLAPQEIHRLFIVLRKLTKNGLSIILITHKLEEVMVAANRVTVMRGGQNIATVDINEVTKSELARMMVGRDVIFQVDKEELEPSDLLLEIKNLRVQNDTGRNSIEDFSLELRKNEIVGLAGVGGNGQGELYDSIIGVRDVRGGKILLEGEDITDLSPEVVYKKGLACIPPDRIKQGILPDLSIEENLLLGRQRDSQFRYSVFLNKNKIQDYVLKSIEEYDIGTSGASQKTSNLSGGNLQKLILARELFGDPKCIVATNPTRGLDISATKYIHNRLLALRERGPGVLLISEDLDEVFKLSDRLGVIFQGKLMGIFKTDEVDRGQVGLLMAGVRE